MSLNVLTYLSQRRYVYLLIPIALMINLFLVFYLVFLQNLTLKPTDCQITGDSRRSFEIEASFILREFEDFENDVVRTVSNFATAFPESRIILISDRLPYPPIILPSLNHVKMVLLHPVSGIPVAQTRPENVINSKYVFMIPDGARVIEDIDVEYMTEFLEENRQRDSSVGIAAWPMNYNKNERIDTKCQDLIFDVRRWTLYHRISSDTSGCNSLDGDRYILLLRRDTFLNLTTPFLRPTYQTLFIQTSLSGLKVVLDRRKPVFHQVGTWFERNAHNQQKYERHESQRLKSAYAELGIKLVRGANGVEHWYGCRKETPRCFGTVVGDMPEFLYHGRWTPPCCLEALRTTGRHVFRVLEEQGVRYWLEGGSLLGAARDGDIIPWDYDIDIGIYRLDIMKSEHLMNCQDEPFTDDGGFVWEKASEGEFFRVQYSHSNRLHVDIFPFYSRNGTMTKNTWFKSHRQDTEFPEAFIQNLTRIKFIGFNASAPHNVTQFLEYKFGVGAIRNRQLPNTQLVN